MTDTPITPDVAAVQQAATRAIHALKSPAPDGSRHYQSGWDDGLEAAIDAVRDGVEGPARTLLAEVDRLRARVAELEEQERFQERNTLPDLHRQIEHHKGGKARWRKRAETAEARVAELEALKPARRDPRGDEMVRRMLRPDACKSCGDIPDEWCPNCAACRQGCHGGHDNNPCTHPNAPWNTEATS